MGISHPSPDRKHGARSAPSRRQGPSVTPRKTRESSAETPRAVLMCLSGLGQGQKARIGPHLWDRVTTVRTAPACSRAVQMAHVLVVWDLLFRLLTESFSQ